MNKMDQTYKTNMPANAKEGMSFLKKVSWILMAAGVVLVLLTFLGENPWERLGFAWLWGFSFFWVVVLGSLFFVALQHLTSSVWSVVLRRVAEILARPMWVGGVLFGVLLILALRAEGQLWFWMFAGYGDGEHSIGADKELYLNLPFFVIRAVVFFLIWIGFARFFVNHSIKQDSQSESSSIAKKMKAWSGPFVLIFALTATFASFDWLMSLEPHWFSSMYGVYVFSGMFVTALAAITLLVLYLRGKGYLGENVVRPDHLYSLGGLLFAMSCFWAYIAFSQYMLIWYGNLPEETDYFIRRTTNGWQQVSWLLIALRFVGPFFLLLSHSAKMNAKILVIASVMIILGELVDIYWLIMPELYGTPVLSPVEIGPVLLMVGLLMGFVVRFAEKGQCLAVGDPKFEESCRFHL